jgi:hypothetical protein
LDYTGNFTKKETVVAALAIRFDAKNDCLPWRPGQGSRLYKFYFNEKGDFHP